MIKKKTYNNKSRNGSFVNTFSSVLGDARKNQHNRIKQNNSSNTIRDTNPLLEFYFKKRQKVQFKLTNNVTIKGMIKRLAPQPLFTTPYIIIEEECGFENKILFNDIKVGSIFPMEKEIKQSEMRKGVPKALKKVLWANHFGKMFKGKCFVCKSQTIYRDNFHAGHVIAVANGGKYLIENLRPICQSCNSCMGTENLDDFKARVFP